MGAGASTRLEDLQNFDFDLTDDQKARFNDYFYKASAAGVSEQKAREEIYHKIQEERVLGTNATPINDSPSRGESKTSESRGIPSRRSEESLHAAAGRSLPGSAPESRRQSTIEQQSLADRLSKPKHEPIKRGEDAKALEQPKEKSKLYSISHAVLDSLRFAKPTKSSGQRRSFLGSSTIDESTRRHRGNSERNGSTPSKKDGSSAATTGTSNTPNLSPLTISQRAGKSVLSPIPSSKSTPKGRDSDSRRYKEVSARMHSSPSSKKAAPDFFVDEVTGTFTCLLCNQDFKSHPQLEKHNKFSEVHMKNVKKREEERLAEIKLKKLSALAQKFVDTLTHARARTRFELYAKKAKWVKKWQFAIRRVKLKNAVTVTRLYLYAITPPEKVYEKPVELFKGSKFFWKSQLSVEIHMHMHEDLVHGTVGKNSEEGDTVIEIIGFDLEKRRELNRIYINRKNMVDVLYAEVKEATEATQKKRRTSLTAVDKRKIENKVMVDYVYNQLKCEDVKDSASAKESSDANQTIRHNLVLVINKNDPPPKKGQFKKGATNLGQARMKNRHSRNAPITVNSKLQGPRKSFEDGKGTEQKDGKDKDSSGDKGKKPLSVVDQIVVDDKKLIKTLFPVRLYDRRRESQENILAKFASLAQEQMRAKSLSDQALAHTNMASEVISHLVQLDDKNAILKDAMLKKQKIVKLRWIHAMRKVILQRKVERLRNRLRGMKDMPAYLWQTTVKKTPSGLGIPKDLLGDGDGGVTDMLSNTVSGLTDASGETKETIYRPDNNGSETALLMATQRQISARNIGRSISGDGKLKPLRAPNMKNEYSVKGISKGPSSPLSPMMAPMAKSPSLSSPSQFTRVGSRRKFDNSSPTGSPKISRHNSRSSSPSSRNMSPAPSFQMPLLGVANDLKLSSLHASSHASSHGSPKGSPRDTDDNKDEYFPMTSSSSSKLAAKLSMRAMNGEALLPSLNGIKTSSKDLMSKSIFDISLKGAESGLTAVGKI